MTDFIVTIDEEKFEINTNHSQKVILNGSKYDIEISKLSSHTYKLKLDNNVFHIPLVNWKQISILF